MLVKITSAFRINEGEGTRKYTPGDVAEGAAAKWAVTNGYGEETTKQEAFGEDKARSAPKNKAKQVAVNK